jgi:AraC family transcriptional regulator
MKKTTKDEYLQAIYKVIYYIEIHYGDDLTVDSLSKVAGFSKYHFHRIFHSIVGESLGAYVRRVRLQMSANKLAYLSITQTAMLSGYETHASFAKAFTKRFGLSPKEFSKKVKEKKGDMMIEPKIVDFKEIEVLYVRRVGEYTKVAGEAFEVLMGFAYKQKIKNKKNLMGKDAVILGIGHDDPNTTPQNELRYDACISYDDKSVNPEGEIGVKTIKGGKHLYYLHKGSYDGLKEVYAKMMDFCVENEMSMADRPPFERYLNRDPRRTKPQNLKTEIFIPLI